MRSGNHTPGSGEELDEITSYISVSVDARPSEPSLLAANAQSPLATAPPPRLTARQRGTRKAQERKDHLSRRTLVLTVDRPLSTKLTALHCAQKPHMGDTDEQRLDDVEEEQLLIARLQLQHCIECGQTDEAMGVASFIQHQLLPSEAAAKRLQLLTGARGTALLSEASLVVEALSQFEEGVDRSSLPSLLGHILRAPAADAETISRAARALKAFHNDDFDAWCDTAFKGASSVNVQLRLLHAAMEVVDQRVCAQLASFYGTRQAIERALRSSLKANRGSALRLVGAMAVRAPAAAHGFISVLTTAYSVEVGALRHYALSLALDSVFAVSRLPDTATQEAAQQLGAALQWLPQVLTSVSVEEQTLAVLGLGKLVLMRHEHTLFTATQDPEALIADIAFRYTAARASVQSDRQSKQWPLLASLLAFFEALADQRRNDVSNTIAWLVLDAVDETLDEALDKTLTRLDLSAERLRCLRFLSSFLDERALTATLQLVRSNLSEMLKGTDCSTPTDSDISQWFGRHVAQAC